MAVHRAIPAEDHNRVNLIHRVSPLDTFNTLKLLQALRDIPRPENGGGSHVPRNLITNGREQYGSRVG